MPYVRGHGDRYEIVADLCTRFARWGTTGGRAAVYGYRNGASAIEFSEAVFMVLLERAEARAELVVGGDDWQARASLEMALDVFCVQEGLSGVTFE